MAELVEGVEYGLSSFGITNANTSLIHVKLTDSAQKAIEELTSYKDPGSSSSRKPSIQFNGTTGTLKIPFKGKGNDDPGNWQSFRLSLGPIQLDAKGSFDCIQQIGGYRGENLELLGSMTHKVSIHANEDSYKTTRERMAYVEEQQKKASAKEIKPSGPNIGKRVKVVKKNSPIPPPPVNRHDRYSPIDPMKNYSSLSSHNSSSKVPSHDHRSQHTSSSTSSSYSKTGSVNTNNTTASSSNSISNHHRSSPSLGTNSSTHLSSSSQNKQTANPEVLKKPLRERIIHLLALKPYKKPEILLKLKNEGIKEKDKNQIGVLLQKVGIFNARDNSYCLGKHLYNEVQLDWVGYRDQDRQLLKRKLALDYPQSSTPPPTSVSPAVSPVHSIGSNQGSPTNSQKRPAAPTDDHEEHAAPNPKKQRISHISNNSNSNRAKPSSRPSSPIVPMQSQPPAPPQPSSSHPADHISNPQPPPAQPTSDKSHNNKSSSRHNRRSSSNNTGSVDQPSDTSSKRKSVQSVPIPHTEDEENNQENNNISKADKEIYDFVSEYKNIDTLDQRQKYKSLFNSEYEEYRQLHGNIEKVTRIFQDLREQLYREEEGSSTYENIKDKIVQEYKELKKDPCYSKNRKRCEYLHKKLAHIKSRILEFDKSKYCNS